MSYKRVILSLTVLATALSVGFPAPAQDLLDMQLFAPPNLSTYGGPRRASEGFFFTFDGLLWAVSTPQVTTIGQPSEQGREVWYGPDPAQTATQNNTHNTSIFGAQVVGGQRYEGGFVDGHHGLLFSGWRLNSQTQDIRTTSMDMVFDDYEWGGELDYRHLDGYVDDQGTIKPLPVTFASANIRNRVETWGVELSYLLRSNPTPSGGYFEVFLGARYLEFNDEFSVHAYGDVVPVEISGETVSGIVMTSLPLGADQETLYTGTLANSVWYQDAKNHIVGPQIGARWFKHYNRWMISAEGRFFAGFNSQSLYQDGYVGDQLNPNQGMLNEPSLPGHVPLAAVPLSLGPTTFTHQSNENEWSPGVEVRVNFEWQWTKNVSFGAGWSGLWMDGIARASNLINYEFGTSSTMGILTQNNRQDVFVNGANFRINVNR
ncbi:MAG: BBP7 family outer membrane beta-barrel protein [Pirellulales bacterium]|nr:BBP7 family outer membrane beta-barrel protein [Pirellulales bacterium]